MDLINIVSTMMIVWVFSYLGARAANHDKKTKELKE